jgi:hypothetical protein
MSTLWVEHHFIKFYGVDENGRIRSRAKVFRKGEGTKLAFAFPLLRGLITNALALSLPFPFPSWVV